jgi:restriction endonuclease-like protein
MFDVWTDGIFPPLAADAERFVREDRVRLHSHAVAVNSSMVFAFNLFLPFRANNAQPLASLLSCATGIELQIDRIQFEYGPTEVLTETQSDPPSTNEVWTSADVGIEVRDCSGRRGIVLVEVKLSEGGFTPCRGRTSSGNQRRDVCESANAFLADPPACYLTRPLRSLRERRYWPIFAGEHGSVRAAFPGADLAGSCPFGADLQQPMRNHALALGLVQTLRFDFARLGLVYHDHNPSVLPHWDQYRNLVADRETLFRVPASSVIEAGCIVESTWSMQWAEYVRARYQLGE